MAPIVVPMQHFRENRPKELEVQKIMLLAYLPVQIVYQYIIAQVMSKDN